MGTGDDKITDREAMYVVSFVPKVLDKLGRCMY
jgi:hypothetical protein